MSGYTAGSSQWVLRRHDQKDFFFFQQFVFQLGVFMYFIENAKIKLIIEQKFFLEAFYIPEGPTWLLQKPSPREEHPGGH